MFFIVVLVEYVMKVIMDKLFMGVKILVID